MEKIGLCGNLAPNGERIDEWFFLL
jgi:hypothetical protein